MTSHEEFTRLFKEVISGRLSRRDVLGRGAMVGAGAAALATFGPGTVLRAAAQDATPDPNAKTGGTLKLGLQADPTALDPQMQSLTAIWHTVEHIYNRLTRVLPDMSIQPELAESIDISDDGLTYTFKLKSGVTFHNGRPMVAADVKYSYERLIDPATASTSAADLASMASIEAPDDATVVITLKAPDASFLFMTSRQSLIIIPKEVVDENGDLSQVAVGTGPFTFKEYVPNTSIKLEKNANYWVQGLPYLDGLELIIAPDDTARTTAVVTGTVDMIEYSPLRDIDSLQSDSSLKLAGDTNNNIRMLGFNLRKEPFDNLKVRQAIAKVIDRDAVLGPAVFGHGTVTSTLFAPDNWAALNVDIPAPDIEGAKALLKEAGYENGFKTTITSWSQYSFLNAAAVVIQEQLKQIGIDAELNLVENSTMINDVYVTFNFDIAVTGDSGFGDPNALILGNFRSDGGGFAGYNNPEVDKLIDQGIAETDQAKRAEIYQQIQQILLEDLPWVNLFIANQYETMKSYVMGYQHVPTGSNIYLRETWLDK